MFNPYPDEALLIGFAIHVVMAARHDGHVVAWMRGQLAQIAESPLLRRAAQQHADRLGLAPPPKDKAEWRAVEMAIDAAMKSVEGLPRRKRP